MDKIEEVSIKLDQLLKENEVKLGYEITFPIYKIIPDEVKLALIILAKHGMTINIVLKK